MNTPPVIPPTTRVPAGEAQARAPGGGVSRDAPATSRKRRLSVDDRDAIVHELRTTTIAPARLAGRLGLHPATVASIMRANGMCHVGRA